MPEGGDQNEECSGEGTSGQNWIAHSTRAVEEEEREFEDSRRIITSGTPILRMHNDRFSCPRKGNNGPVSAINPSRGVGALPFLRATGKTTMPRKAPRSTYIRTFLAHVPYNFYDELSVGL